MAAGPAGQGRADQAGRTAPVSRTPETDPSSRPPETAPSHRRFRARVVPSDEGHGVTPLELFFDLVFVFAITQVTAFMAEDLGWRSALRGLVLLALLWWAWCSYAWLGNQAHADEGVVRVAVIVAMAAMFLVALAIPEAWGDEGGGLSAPVVLAVGVGRRAAAVHLAVYAVAAGGDRALRRQLLRTAVPVVPAAVPARDRRGAGRHRTDRPLGAGSAGRLHGDLRVGHRLAVAGARPLRRAPRTDRDHRPRGVADRRRCRRRRPAADRADGRGGAARARGRRAHCGGRTSTWSRPWPSECSSSLTGTDRVRLARDSYTYLHFPMVAGVIYLALGLKKVAEYVGDTAHHSLADPLPTTAVWALYGGVAAYLIGHLGFRLRNIGSINRPRALVAAVLLVAPPAVGQTPGAGRTRGARRRTGRPHRLRGRPLRRGARRGAGRGGAPLRGRLRLSRGRGRGAAWRRGRWP